MVDGRTGPAQPEAVSPRQRALKWLGFRAAALFLVLACVEGFSFVALRLMRAMDMNVSVSDYGAGAAELERLNNPDAQALKGMGPDFDEVLHPYVGYVLTHHEPGQQDLSDLGWLQRTLYTRSRERVIVALTGGSVAHQVYELASELLKAELAKVPRFQGREVVLLNLCLGGYKQPQQLMILNYLLSLGGELDVVLNLDGFNEVALHGPENGRNGVFPIFPRWWQGRVNDVADPALRALTGELAYLRKELEELQAWRGMRPLRYLQTGRLWRVYRVKRVHREIGRVVDEIAQPSESGARRYVASGPRWQFDQEELYDHLTDIWARASLQMHHLSRGNGIEYYHFLQPNQYVEGSKPMGPEERRRAYDPRMRYRPGAVAGYPKLIARGQRLRDAGLQFRDLTQLFVNEEAPLYRDTCCHLLPAGVEILTRAMVQTVREAPASTAAP